MLRKLLAAYGIGGAHVVSGARVVREGKKNAWSPVGGSLQAKTVKGGVCGGLAPLSQKPGILGDEAPSQI